jgi:hypothetical protein
MHSFQINYKWEQVIGPTNPLKEKEEELLSNPMKQNVSL